jgi:hypothetical protein
MTKTEQIREVGMVSAIIADHITKKLYKKMQANGTGYISTIEQISEWAIEFVEKHKNTKWEDVLMDETIKPISKAIKSIICWDDAVFDFAQYKLENF